LKSQIKNIFEHLALQLERVNVKDIILCYNVDEYTKMMATHDELVHKLLDLEKKSFLKKGKLDENE